jgi:hypothetical protein
MKYRNWTWYKCSSCGWAFYHCKGKDWIGPYWQYREAIHLGHILISEYADCSKRLIPC